MHAPATPLRKGKIITTLITLLVGLMLVVSMGPSAHADPAEPGEPSPTISAIERSDDQPDPPTPPEDPPSVGNAPDEEPATVGGAPSTLSWRGPRVQATPRSPGGRIPPSLDTSAINNGQYQSKLGLASSLPSSYDMRYENPTWLTELRDQGYWGTCWAFAAAAAAESSIVRNGALTGTEPVIDRQISPLHTVQAVYYTNTFKADTSHPMSWYGPYDIGGNEYQAAAAWSHWYGAEKEAKYPYPDEDNQFKAPKVPANLRTSAYHLKSVYILPSPRDMWGEYQEDNVRAIKEAVYTYGAISAAFSAYMMLSSDYYDPVNKSFYSPEWDWSDHAVIIIGWDDNFSASKFSHTPEGNGAFLIRNSWGEDLYDYFWMSYYDKTMDESAVFDLISSATTPNRHSPYDWTGQYAYDELGIGDWIIEDTGTISEANRFTVKSDTTLRAVQFTTLQPNVSYSVSVYTGSIAATSPVSGGKAQPLTLAGATSVTGKLTYAGYNTVTLEKPVILKKGQKFSIVVKLDAPDTDDNLLIPVEATYDFGAGKHKLTISTGQSFIRVGGKWKDLTTFYKQWKATGWLGNLNIIGLTSQGPAYKLFYDAGAGSVATPSKSVAFGSALGTLATPTRAGYTFAGWYTAPVGGTKYTSATTYLLLADATVHAHWTPKKFKITFKPNGGTAPKTGSKATATKSVTFDSTYGKLPTSTRKGYSFAGWFTAKSGGTKISSDDVVALTKATTLYAHWTAKELTVKLNPRSGTVAEPSVKVTYGKTYGALPTPIRGGYSFSGWYTKASGGTKIKTTTKVTITANQTLYAHWTAKKFKVTFDPWYGSTPKIGNKVTKTKTVTFDKKYGTLPKSTLKGFRLVGWYTEPNFGGEQIKSSTKVKVAGPVTLYARWASTES